MFRTLKTILEGALARLDTYVTTILPSLLAALVLVFAAWLIAACARWLLYRMFKGPAIDRFLRTSGLAFTLDPKGRIRSTRIVAETTYWAILLSGLLLGLSAFDNAIATLMLQNFMLLLPKLVVAGIIILAGVWLGQYLGRSIIVWAVNEELPSPRRLAMAVRIIIMFVAVVVAADQLDFARSVFLAAFIIFVGGTVMAASIAAGIGAADRFRRFFGGREEIQNENGRERSLWSHL